MSDELNFSDLAEEHVSDAHVAEATAFKTVPNGAYKGIAANIDLKVGDEKSPWPGRKMGHIRFSLKDKDDNKKGSIFTDLSWEAYRIIPESNPRKAVKVTDENRDETKTWALDGPYKLYCQAQKTVTSVGEGLSVKGVFDALREQYVTLYITEAFKNPADKTQKAEYYKTDAERVALVERGWQPQNYVQTIAKVK